MTKRAFDKIAGGLREAISVARGEAKPDRLFIPSAIDVREIRRKTGLSQDDFADAYGFTRAQIRDWEQGRSRPIGGVRAYLMLIAQDPEKVRKLLAKMAA